VILKEKIETITGSKNIPSIKWKKTKI
jgi:hypothetical protein